MPSVAELPTCQNTLHGEAPPIRGTVLSDAVISVDPAWKMNTALGSPPASRVTVPPFRRISDAELYTPGARVCPSRMVTESAGVRDAASLYAVLRSSLAWSATASAAWVAPITWPGGKPVTAVPGLTPTSPVMIDGPVLVTVEPASTANGVAVPNPTGACTDAANAAGAPTIPATSPMAVMVPTAITALTPRRGLSPRATPVTDVTNFPDQRNVRMVSTLATMGCAREPNRSSWPVTSAVQRGYAVAGFLTRPGRRESLTGEQNRNREATEWHTTRSSEHFPRTGLQAVDGT